MKNTVNYTYSIWL